VLCLVSGGPDSTCLFHAMRELGYRVSALHVNYCLRGEESEEDARFCAQELGADVVRIDARGASEAELRAIRYGPRPIARRQATPPTTRSRPRLPARDEREPRRASSRCARTA
jgi:tRNA(Ile)-lysidine synthase TilS/MesJ